MRRNWIKLYVDQTLRGSCFDELLPDERFVWFGFLLLAGDNALEGKICITEKMGYTIEQLAELLKCKKELVDRSIKKMAKVKKIKLYKNNVVKIINWQKYQSEYQRQKPYRSNPELLDGVIKEVTAQSDTLERERDIEGERDKKEKKIKKEKEKKIKYLDFVFLTQKEYGKLIIKLGKPKTESIIENLNNGIGSKGYKYKSHYHTILNWIRREKENNGRTKTEGQDWDNIKEKRDDYKHTDRPEKITKEIYGILAKTNPKYRERLNKLRKGE